MLRWYFSTTFSYSITTEKLTGEESIDWICRRVLDFFFTEHFVPSEMVTSCCVLCCGAGFGGCDWRGVCASDAGAVRLEELADSEREAAAGGVGGGAGLPGAGPQPC